jgi:hypothetical protein
MLKASRVMVWWELCREKDRRERGERDRDMQKSSLPKLEDYSNNSKEGNWTN